MFITRLADAQWQTPRGAAGDVVCRLGRDGGGDRTGRLVLTLALPRKTADDVAERTSTLSGNSRDGSGPSLPRSFSLSFSTSLLLSLSGP